MIRKMTEHDIMQVVNLEEKHLGQSLGALFFQNELTYFPNPYYLVYELGKEIIGYIGYRIHDDVAEMMNFVVKKEYQNQGYGSWLLEMSVEDFKKMNIQIISLEVRKNNVHARRFYEKHGFVVSHIKQKYYDQEDGIVYTKEVKS